MRQRGQRKRVLPIIRATAHLNAPNAPNTPKGLSLESLRSKKRPLPLALCLLIDVAAVALVSAEARKIESGPSLAPSPRLFPDAALALRLGEPP